MKIIHFRKLEFIPAGHEDPKKPAVLKKVLFKKEDLVKGKIQMINWAKLTPNRSSKTHYHQNMEEVYIILNGKAELMIGDEKKSLKRAMRC